MYDGGGGCIGDSDGGEKAGVGRAQGDWFLKMTSTREVVWLAHEKNGLHLMRLGVVMRVGSNDDSPVWVMGATVRHAGLALHL